MSYLKKTFPPGLHDKDRITRILKRTSGSKENIDTAIPKEKNMYGSNNVRQVSHRSLMDFYKRLYKLTLSDEGLKANNFPAEGYKSPYLITEGSDCRSCVRCSARFEVPKGIYLSASKCWYHPLKAIYDGPLSSFKKHPCCGKIIGDEGCTNHPYHVTDKHGPKTVTKTASRHRDPQYRIYSLDCEMSYTTAGLEVTRIGLVDIDETVVYHSYVKPKNKILDYNTQYSGVEKRHLENLTTTLDDAKAVLDDLVDEDTILIGHALNNDLEALGLIHRIVVDTSVMYADEETPWKKRSLKSLASEFLDISIQNGPSGHNCVDDARVCLRLALLKVLPSHPTLHRPFPPIVDFVPEQPVIPNEDIYEQNPQQTLKEIQNFNYPPISFAYDVYQRQEELMGWALNPRSTPRGFRGLCSNVVYAAH